MRPAIESILSDDSEPVRGTETISRGASYRRVSNVSGAIALSDRPVGCPASNTGYDSSPVIGIAIVADLSVPRAVDLEDWDIGTTWRAYGLNWCSSLDVVGICVGRASSDVGVEGATVGSKCGDSIAEDGITGEHAHKTSAVAEAESPDSSSVYTEPAVEVVDEGAHEANVIKPRSWATSRIAPFRCRSVSIVDTSNIDSDAIWIECSLVQPGLVLYVLRAVAPAVETENQR